MRACAARVWRPERPPSTEAGRYSYGARGALQDAHAALLQRVVQRRHELLLDGVRRERECRELPRRALCDTACGETPVSLANGCGRSGVEPGASGEAQNAGGSLTWCGGRRVRQHAETAKFPSLLQGRMKRAALIRNPHHTSRLTVAAALLSSSSRSPLTATHAADTLGDSQPFAEFRIPKGDRARAFGHSTRRPLHLLSCWPKQKSTVCLRPASFTRDVHRQRMRGNSGQSTCGTRVALTVAPRVGVAPACSSRRSDSSPPAISSAARRWTPATPPPPPPSWACSP